MVAVRSRGIVCALALFASGFAGCAEMGSIGAPWGSVQLTAKDSQIVGKNAKVASSRNVDYVGYWDNADTSIQWTVKDLKPGKYHVAAVYALDEEFRGSTIEVSVDGSKAKTQLDNTKSWDDYRTIALGDVTVPSGPQTTVALKVTEKPHQYVMNLKELTLTPAN